MERMGWRMMCCGIQEKDIAASIQKKVVWSVDNDVKFIQQCCARQVHRKFSTGDTMREKGIERVRVVMNCRDY